MAIKTIACPVLNSFLNLPKRITKQVGRNVGTLETYGVKGILGEVFVGFNEGVKMIGSTAVICPYIRANNSCLVDPKKEKCVYANGWKYFSSTE